jgi:hypothetical protein
MDMYVERIADSSRRRSLIGGSDARINIRDDEAALVHVWREGRRETEPEDLSGEPRQPPGRASANPSGNPVRAAHAAFVTALAGHPPRPIPVEADAIDLEDRADHLNKVLSALSVYVTVILDDTAQNVPGGLDLGDAEAVLADLASDLAGTIQLAADGMAGRVA